MSAITLILNGKELEVSDEFRKFLSGWYTVGTLRDFEEDTLREDLKVGFTDGEVQQINEQPTMEQRRAQALFIYDRERFEEEKRSSIQIMAEGKRKFLNLNIPWWQKALSYAYMHRAEIKAKLGVRYPRDEIVAGVKHDALFERTKDLITENHKE